MRLLVIACFAFCISAVTVQCVGEQIKQQLVVQGV